MTGKNYPGSLGMAVMPLFFFVFILAACNKDKEEKDDLPVLGTCRAVTPSGRLSYSAETGIYTFSTNGRGIIRIDLNGVVSLKHNNYAGFEIQLWGDRISSTVNFEHENLNGKHIKDWQAGRRSIIFPDGAKITLSNEAGYRSPSKSISIYDGSEVHRFNTTCAVLEYSSGTARDIARRLDELEADGETGAFELTDTGLLFFNMYDEKSPGNKEEGRYNLGEIFRNEPNQINDYFDDPRIGHT